MVSTKKIQNVTWAVREGVETGMLERLIERLREHDRHPEFTLLKDNNVRTGVLYATGLSAAPEVFVKRYKTRGLPDVVKYLFFPSKALAEWRALCRFEARGLPCPRPLAFAEVKKGAVLHDSCLVMESLSPCASLHDFFSGAQTSGYARRLQLTRALSLMVRRLHDCGVFYRDLHAGNILLCRQGSGAPQLFFIDLHRALFLPKLMPWMRVRDLAQLCNSIAVSGPERTRFLKQYCEGTTLDGQAFRAFQKKIDSSRQRLEARRIISRSKRCVKNSTVFEKKSSWLETFFGRRDFGRTALDHFLDLHRAQRGGRLKASSKSVLSTHDPSGGVAVPVCVKHYRYLGPWYALKSLFRKSRALKSWMAANGLIVRGIETPLPLALYERTWGPLVMESFYVSQWLPDAFELNDVVRQLPARLKAPFIEAAAAAVCRLHARGVYHADLKSNNILVRRRGRSAWDFCFVDLDRVLFRPALSFQQRANNLAQINASVADVMTVKDRLRFFRLYARGTTLYRERKKFYRTIIEIGRAKVTGPYGVTFHNKMDAA